MVPNKMEATEISADSLADTMGDLPEVTETILNHETSPAPAPVPPGLTDTKGRSFDKELHCVDENGAPIITTKGKLKLKKRGRPSAGGEKGDTNDATENGNKISSVAGIPTPPNQAEIEAMTTGYYAADLLITVGQSIGGDEWRPKIEPIDERRNLQEAFGKYFVAKEIADIPPGIALTMAVGAYVGPRLFMPETKKKTKSFAEKAKQWFRWKKFNAEENKKEAAEIKKAEEKKDAD